MPNVMGEFCKDWVAYEWKTSNSSPNTLLYTGFGIP
jgi:hypothetical protein